MSTVYIDEPGDYYISTYTEPTNNRIDGNRLPYGLQINGGDIQTIYTLEETYAVDHTSSNWSNGVIRNTRITSVPAVLNEGVNTIRFYSLEAGQVLSKIVCTKDKPGSESAFGVQESYITGTEATQQPLVCDIPEDEYIVPGKLSSSSSELIISRAATYDITANGDISEDAVISVYIDGGEIGQITYDADDNRFALATNDELQTGRHTFSYSVVSGTASINNFEFLINDGRVKVEPFNDDFTNESSASSYSQYLDGNGNFSVSGGQLMGSDFNSPYDSNNGIRRDITELVKGMSGTSFGASADVYATNNGESSVFFEIVSPDGTTETIVLDRSADYSDNRVSLSGETDVMEFDSDDKVYLCVTQYSGYCGFDNIKLWLYAARVSSELFTDRFIDSSSDTLYDVYNKTENPAESMSSANGNLDVNFTNSWSSNNGIRRDITESVKGLSGSTFGVSFDFTAWVYIRTL